MARDFGTFRVELRLLLLAGAGAERWDGTLQRGGDSVGVAYRLPAANDGEGAVGLGWTHDGQSYRRDVPLRAAKRTGRLGVACPQCDERRLVLHVGGWFVACERCLLDALAGVRQLQAAPSTPATPPPTRKRGRR